MKVEVEVPNEGPVIDGFVKLPDGSGVLPPFWIRIKCSQCGESPEFIADRIKDKPCRCGRTTVQLTEQP